MGGRIEPESLAGLGQNMQTVPVSINQDMKALVLTVPAQGEYLLRALKGMKPFMLKRVQRSSHGTCRLEASDYTDFAIPMPPPHEQHLIIAKIDELVTLCDQLGASLVTGDVARSRLLDSVLREAISIDRTSGAVTAVASAASSRPPQKTTSLRA